MLSLKTVNADNSVTVAICALARRVRQGRAARAVTQSSPQLPEHGASSKGSRVDRRVSQPLEIFHSL